MVIATNNELKETITFVNNANQGLKIDIGYQYIIKCFLLIFNFKKYNLLIFGII